MRPEPIRHLGRAVSLRDRFTEFAKGAGLSETVLRCWHFPPSLLHRSGMGALGKLLRLSSDDRWLLLRAFAAVSSAWVAVRMLPASAVLRKISAEIPLPSRHKPQTTGRIGWAVTVAARYIPGSKCLVQAIAGRNLLASYGFSSEIHIGVAKDSKNWLNAHAWVEADGKTVIGGDTAAYAPLISSSQEYRP
jgi:hypothetical protein